MSNNLKSEFIEKKSPRFVFAFQYTNSLLRAKEDEKSSSGSRHRNCV